ncbi:FACT complex subunit Ssrp1 [Bradysia coprophila]|uniref:FACT complex subunit Ssrp1 n=1 Tax=Bradysia coprophila TaxID=38358 RepID=UPI00187D8870|nr:FACT complex subunit Ssrp1 [Bradysia coprophila]
MDILEFSDIMAEVKGSMTSGRLKLTDQNIIFKNSKTGKVEQILADDVELANYQRFVGFFGIRLFMKNGNLHRYTGFKSGDEEKISKFFKTTYNKDCLEKELSLKGWNWGTVHFTGSVLSFDCDKKTSFEIPLQHVSQCTTGKNEVTIEFHQNDDAPVSLMEMRMHIPASESSEIEPVDAFYQNVMKQASVISVSGDAIAIFREIQCLTPRGRYDIKIFQTFFQLHGKTFDYKIPMSTVLRLFLLPHKDNRQMFFVLSLDPPIKQGQTRYHYLVLLFSMEEETSIELPFTDTELKEKYEDKLTKDLSGPVYEVLGKVMKVLINRKLTGPGSFVGHTGTPAIGCSFKAAAGLLYPLERGFMYVHKPPIHIRFEEIASVNFARSGGSTRSFDFEIELKSNTVHTFSSIEKEEYSKLFDFINAKKIHVKNTGKNDKSSYKDDFGDSDNENEPDAYLARVKAEAKERDSDDDGGDSDESTDEDFNPGEQNDDDVAEEFDSNVSTSDSDEEGGSDNKASEKKKEKKKERKEKKRDKKEPSESKSKKSKSKRVEGQPKRAQTAFLIFINEKREQIKNENPGIKVTEISKKGGEMWRELKDKSEWEQKANKDKERYADEMKKFKGSSTSGGEKSSPAKRKHESPGTNKGGFKSKEYISDDDSSDSDTKGSKKKVAKVQDKNDKSSKSSKKSSKDDDDDDEEEEEDDDEEEESTGEDSD